MIAAALQSETMARDRNRCVGGLVRTLTVVRVEYLALFDLRVNFAFSRVQLAP